MVLSRSSAQEHKAGVALRAYRGGCEPPHQEGLLERLLSTHLFAFHDLDEAIFRSFPVRILPRGDLGDAASLPSGDFTAADAVARRMAEHGIRVASVHAPCTGRPDIQEGPLVSSPLWTRRIASRP